MRLIFNSFLAEMFIRVGELAQLFICYYRWNGRFLTKVRFSWSKK